ncbi:MAG: damage-inducible protein DinB [Chlorobiaceae bacterium]|nr:damage-inducible protein DinB [Chlorobiaceae bacterium]
MDTLTLLRELSGHTQWADAVVFSAIDAHPEAGKDERLLGLLRHLHLVQKVFLDVWRNKTINPEETRSFDILELEGYVRGNHREFGEFLDTLTNGMLDAPVRLPWAELVSRNLGFEVAEPTLGETLIQVHAHSAYHRGQVNSRLRELGINPPMTDYIAWVWALKPPASWSGKTS